MPKQITGTVKKAWSLIRHGQIVLSRTVTTGFAGLSTLIILVPALLGRERNQLTIGITVAIRLLFLWTLYAMINLEVQERLAAAEQISKIGRSLNETSEQTEQVSMGIRDKTLSCDDAITRLVELARSLKVLAANL